MRPGGIYEVGLVGNPVMRDLFFGLDVYPLGQMPYRSVPSTSFTRANALALTWPNAETIVLPIHPDGGFTPCRWSVSPVGSDTAACLLATGLAREERWLP
ncbi:MAG: hypothetical protein Ct9H300mP32_4970 [Verrucomicrobiota bacterium]|nr:MAG: hypothetical protein Ct9H300mP32_4970 [Verrucomicrobiota bacterium]